MKHKRWPWSGMTRFQWFVHLAAWAPLAWLAFDWLTSRLSVNPIQDLTLRTGKAALWLLVLSLAATPANTLLGFRPALRVRRALGLYAFGYALLHFLVFVWVDYGLDFALILQDVGSKRYVLVGFSAFLILLPLALTSTQGWMKRMGKNWKRLHRWVYLAGVLAVVHYVWLVKSDIREPLTFGAAVLLLLAARIPQVRSALSRLRSRLQGLVAGGKTGKLSF
jgi:sulfoxide reductase heme-binding subunit YedZ